MSYKVKTIPTFDKQAKRLAKKYHSLKSDLVILINELLINPEFGTGIGQNCFKIRLSIKSKKRGKSGGARVITHVHVVAEDIFLLSIYDKSEKENLDENELDELLQEIY
ncbi:MAG: type II toxin-antitoxin system RelE/ParE family toxin [Arcicella sp.]|jgi:mRNA-degrading endonuclease RelE of RelBE toxin-antitoxin system|nr:type II toxin-antitoxin system RelE/ParE family toxin [Arcicella sp.]